MRGAAKGGRFTKQVGFWGGGGREGRWSKPEILEKIFFASFILTMNGYVK